MRRKLQLLLALLLALPAGMLAQGTTWQTATQLPLGQEKGGQLSKDRNEDWWRFTVTADGVAQVICTPGDGLNVSDVRLYYMNADETDYWQRTDNAYTVVPGWYQGRFTTTNLAPGDYLLKVQRGDGGGSYNIKVEFTANSFANDNNGSSWQQPDVLPLNTPKQGHLGFGYAKSGEDNEDWWTFTVTEDGAATITLTPGDGLNVSDVRLYYMNADETDCWQRTDNAYTVVPIWYQGSFTTTNLAPGRYLLRVQRGEGQGGYELTCNFVPQAFANDNNGSSWQQPDVLPLNTPKQGHLGFGYVASYEDNEDWWTFTVTEDGAATITLTPGDGLNVSDVRLYYMNADETDFWQRTDNAYTVVPGWYQGSFTTTNLAPGRYLLKVQRGEGQGGYDLTCNFAPQAFKNDNEPNNSWSDGLANNYIARGQEKQGHLGYGYTAGSEDNEDWFHFKVPHDGTVSIVYTPTNENSALNVGDVRLYYMNEGRTDYWQRTDNAYTVVPGWYSATLTVPNMAAGDYLVKVQRAEGYGAYTLKYEFTQDPLPTDQEPNDSWTQRVRLEEGKTQSGHLGYGYKASSDDNEDWYEVTMTKKGTLKINIQPGDGLNISDVRLYYMNEGKTDCWQRTQGNYTVVPGWYFASLSTDDVEPGDYLIKVQRGQGQGNYRIAFNADITEVEPLAPLPDEEVDPQPGDATIDEFTLWYTLDIGGTVAYKLSEKPQVRLLGAETTVTSSRGVASFETMKIWKFTLNAAPTVGISAPAVAVRPEAEGSVSRSDDALVFSGCRPGEPVGIYTTGGRLVSRHRIGSDGSLELSLGSLRPGLYIVKAGSVNIKFLKK